MNSPFPHTDAFIAELKVTEALINQGKLQDAATRLNSLSRSAPRDPRLYLLASRLAEASNNIEGILVAAHKAYELAPMWPVAAMHMATVLSLRGRNDESIAFAHTAIELAGAQGSLDLELFDKVTSLAHGQRRYELALHWLEMADSRYPNSPLVLTKIARTHIANNDAVSAIPVFDRLLSSDPADVGLRLERLKACLAAGLNDLARADAQSLLEIDPDNKDLAFYLAIANGETPPSQPEAVVADEFDRFARNFDHTLIVELQYKLPDVVAKLIHKWHPDKRGDILDLGCGTGLLGACLGRTEGVLVGVDLSEKMVAQAAMHNVYDKFHLVNVLDALHETPAHQYHVIAALEVFVYIGDLGPVIPNAFRVLVAGGHFVFSCESNDDAITDYAMGKSLRYKHSKTYVRQLLTSAGFEDIEVTDQVLRLERGEPVHGFLVVAHKPN